MVYKEAIDVLFTKLPMFQRSGPAAYKSNLDGTKAVCKMLDNPAKLISDFLAFGVVLRISSLDPLPLLGC